MFDTVLIANRGEIACRIIRTLRDLGVTSVAVYSDPDASALHVQLADVAVNIGPAAAADSYLSIPRIIAAAQATGAQAIHPGYGFLSENAAFATACAEAGIAFVGPSGEALTIMGDKISAKMHVSARGVPVVPGLSEPGLSDEKLSAGAVEVGFPVLIKPSAGGGGKGMHVVGDLAGMSEALATARREAASSFGDDTLFVERFVQNPRHIEVQVLADSAGNILYLGERECSLQRRHQKIIEEAPSPLLDEQTRARIGRAAVDTARSVSYQGAGTVEFIVSADAPDEFFFMEMNTRLQVEHPVTESVTGIDLVAWQLKIAAGEELDFSQADVVLTGHAIEARIYAEDPQRGFLPTGGRVERLVQPIGEGIRVDSALADGLVVSSDYDPMLAKVIAWAPDRASALQRLQAALSQMVTLGVNTNVEFLKLLLADPDVVSGALDTELIERHWEEYRFRPVDSAVLAAAALVLHSGTSAAGAGGRLVPGWRIGENAASSYRVRADAVVHLVRVLGPSSDCTVSVDDGEAGSASITLRDGVARVTLAGVTTALDFVIDDNRILLSQGGASWALEDVPFEREAAQAGTASSELRSPMPGSVVAVFVNDGDLVADGAPILSIEAMKMEHVLRASHAGTIAVRVALGSQVSRDELVASIEREPENEHETEEVP